jgi:hypothetical protein
MAAASTVPAAESADGLAAAARTRRHEVLVLVFLASTLLALATTTSIDPDLWGHVRFGLDMLEQHRVHADDPYSFTSDRPWVNHEWLAEVVLAASYQAAGGTGLMLLKVALIAATALILYPAMRLRASPAQARLLLLVPLAALVPLTRTVRPQLFSILAFGIMLAVVLRYRASRQARWLVALPPLFCLWANAHGGWVLGGATLAALLLPGAARGTLRERLVIAATLISCAAAPLLNPYGLGLYTFLAETLSVPRPEIVEWRPVLYAGLDWIALWLATAVVGAFWFRRGYWRRHPANALLILVFDVLAFQVARLIGFAALVTAALLSEDGSAASGARRAPVQRARTLRLSPVAVALVLVATCGSAAVVVSNLRCLADTESWAVPAGDAAFLRDALPAGRLLTWFNWGQYAMWHLGPAVKVSFDGRRETVYSQRFIDEHMNLYAAGPGWRAILDRLAPQLVWLPPTAPLADRLRTEGWHVVRRTPGSVILARAPLERAERPPSGSVATSRCFPAP